jgi:hypothetical protein
MFMSYKMISEHKTIRLSIKKQVFSSLRGDNLDLNRGCVTSLA